VLEWLGAVVVVPLLPPVAGLVSLGRRLGADVNVAFPPPTTVAETLGAAVVAVEPLLPAVAGLSPGRWLGAVVLSFPPTTTIVSLLPPVAATTTTAVDDDGVADKSVDEGMFIGPKLVVACVVGETVVVFKPGRAVDIKIASLSFFKDDGDDNDGLVMLMLAGGDNDGKRLGIIEVVGTLVVVGACVV
jgi:hypothetical protein